LKRLGIETISTGFKELKTEKSRLQAAKELNQTAGTVIYFTVDYDAQPTDMDHISKRIRAASLAILIIQQVYGSIAVIEEMQERLAIYLANLRLEPWPKSKGIKSINIAMTS